MELGHPVRDLEDSLRNATLGLVFSYLSLTRTLSDALSFVCVGICHCMEDRGSARTCNCWCEREGRQGPSAALAWLTAICVVVSSRYCNRK